MATLRQLLYASALMFVAYMGYGRTAMLGEEVRAPRHTIPRAIVVMVVLAMLLYVGVAVGTIGADRLGEAVLGVTAPREVVAREFGLPFAPTLIANWCDDGNAGVLLNLILGLSRVRLVLVGSEQTTWSFSVFTVLVYNALTNLSALRLADAEHFYPRWISWLGLIACAGLAFSLSKGI